VLDFVLHFDKHLLDFVRDYGAWVYAILFTIVFAETGFVVTPFLPGDSLLFAAGALCATGELSLAAMLALLVAAAFAGNAVNYAVGRFIGPRVFQSSSEPIRNDPEGVRGSSRDVAPDDHARGQGSHRLLNRDYLDRAHAFFEEYGGKAIILGRFVPIVRTFVPFVAGAAQMTAASFVLYNAVGAIAWVALCLGAGWLFGNVPIVKNNFSLVTVGIVVVSILPMVFEMTARRRGRRGTA
jgi:membrane-associated protein